MVSTVNWFGSSVGDTFNLHCEQLQLLHYTMTALNEKLYMDILYNFFFFFFESDILYNCTCIIQLLHSRFITENGKGATIIGKFMDLRTR